MSFVKYLPKLARYSVDRITVAVSEKYARRCLRLKKKDPLAYNGVPLNCIGSPAWRRRHRIDEQSADKPTCSGD
jgi:hypothetical protein